MAERPANNYGRTRKHKGSRARARYFADVPNYASDTSGGFSPLPWVLRRVISILSPREWQLLTYLMMRAGPEFVIWQTDSEIAFDLDIGARKLAPHFKSLQEKGFVVIKEDEGQRFICIPDPLHVLRALVARGEIHTKRLHALNDDLEIMGLEPIKAPPNPRDLSRPGEPAGSSGVVS